MNFNKNNLGQFCFGIFVMLFDGFVLMCLWSWFIAKTFHIAPLTYPQSFGFGITFSFLSQNVNVATTPDSTVMKRLVNSLTCAIIVLFVGFLCHFFV